MESRAISFIKRNTRLGVGTILALAILVLGASLFLFERQQSSISRYSEVRKAGEAYLSSLKDIETSYRGYVIVGSEAYLDPYKEALAALPSRFSELKGALVAASINLSVTERATASSQKVVDFAKQVIEARRISVEEARALVRSGQGKTVMEEARDAIADITSIADANSNILRKNGTITFTIAAILSLLAIAVASYALFRIAKLARLDEESARLITSDIVVNAPIGLAILDADNVITQHNKSFAQLVGKPDTSVVSQNLSETTWNFHEASKLIQDGCRKCRHTHEPVFLDNVEVTDGDEPRFLDITIFPVSASRYSRKSKRGAGVVLTDVTRQRKWELELEEARNAAEASNRAKSAFLANMSHELRTPLTAVLGYCELIEDDLADSPESHIIPDLQKISLNAKHLLTLINDVLDLSKIEAQKMEVHSIEFNISDMLKEIEAATGSLVLKNENQLVLKQATPNMKMLNDDLKIKQVLLNLVSNASKFTSNGTVTVAVEDFTREGTPFTRFRVSDTGIGMTKEQIKGLFERFNQADTTTTRKYGGTGLGLALTRALAHILGGEILVDSTPGQGSVFTLEVPTDFKAKAVEEPAEGDGVKKPAAMTDKEKENAALVLIVDDEPSARELLERLLEKEGFATVSVSNGAQALEKLKDTKPIAVLLDIMMPGMDGWHVLRAIRKNPDTANIPVIIQTVLDDQNFAFAMGASGFIKKPVKRQQLSEILGDLETQNTESRALIIDGDEKSSAELKAMLEEDGWKVTISADADTAKEDVKDEPPNVIIVDMKSSDMRNYKYAKDLQQARNWSAIPLVVMTSEGERAKKVKTLHTKSKIPDGTMNLAELVLELRRFSQMPQASAESQNTAHQIEVSNG